jgi:hypothetical protein
MLTVKELHVLQRRCFRVEALGLHIADRRVQRREDAEDAHAVSGVVESDGLQPAVDDLEVGGFVARFQFRPHQGQRVAFEGCCS